MKAPFIVLLMISVAATGFAGEFDDLLRIAPECALDVARATGVAPQGEQVTPRVRALSNHEIEKILRNIEGDPTLGAFRLKITTLLRGESQLSKVVRQNDSPEARFFVGYLKWLAYRSKKGEIVGKEANEEKAKIDPALQRTNVMEIMDQIVNRLVDGGEAVPEPILRLLNELLQSGIERIQEAADSWSINGRISEIVKTLEFLQSGEKTDSRALYQAIMKLWELDTGCRYAVQKILTEFTPEEKEFFKKLDPRSPLVLPSRNYTDMEVKAIQYYYHGKPFSEITGPEADRAVAEDYRWGLPYDTMEVIKAKYPDTDYRNITIEQIDGVLRDMGKMALVERAAKMRSGFRVSFGERPAHSLRAGAPARPGAQNAGNSTSSLVAVGGTHPVALAIAAPTELAAFGNAAFQLKNLVPATYRMEVALAKMNARDARYESSLEIYRTYLNMAAYAPHDLANSHGLFDVLSVASLEHGTTEDQRALLNLVHGGYDRLRDRMWSAQYNGGKIFREIALSLFNFVEAREKWDESTLHFVFDKIAWLDGFAKPADLTEADGENAFLEIQTARRSEKLSEDEIDLFMTNTSVTKYVEYGILGFKLSSIDKSATGAPGPVALVSDLTETQRNSGEVYFEILKLEDVLKAKGFKGYQIDDPTLHLETFLRGTGGFEENVHSKPFGQNKSLRKYSRFYKSFSGESAPAVNLDFSELNRFLNHRAYNGIVNENGYEIVFRKVDFNMVSEKSGRTLTITSINADKPGSGLYESLLHGIEIVAKEHGYVALIIEGVDNSRQWDFYEKKMHYKRDPRNRSDLRIYFTTLQ